MDKTRIIKNLIDSTGLSLKSFSEKADMPYTTVRSMLERGIDNASIINVIKICKALNISIDELISEDENTIPSPLERNLVSIFNQLNHENKSLLTSIGEQILIAQNKSLDQEDN